MLARVGSRTTAQHTLHRPKALSQAPAPMYAARVGGATGGTEKEGTCPWGMTCDQGSHGRRMTGMLTRCWAELKLTERDMRNCWTRHEKNIGFNK